MFYSYAVSIPPTAYALFCMLAVFAFSLEHFIDISDICEKMGNINLLKAHFVYIVGIFPSNSERRMFV